MISSRTWCGTSRAGALFTKHRELAAVDRATLSGSTLPARRSWLARSRGCVPQPPDKLRQTRQDARLQGVDHEPPPGTRIQESGTAQLLQVKRQRRCRATQGARNLSGRDTCRPCPGNNRDDLQPCRLRQCTQDQYLSIFGGIHGSRCINSPRSIEPIFLNQCMKCACRHFTFPEIALYSVDIDLTERGSWIDTRCQAWISGFFHRTRTSC
jgi:hypothetical protein